MRTYANGSLVQSHAGSGPLGDVAPTQNDFRIGGRQGSSQYFQGLIDEVALFNRALSADELAAIHAAGTNGMCKDALPPTLLSWPSNQFVPLGSNVTLTATASGTEPLNYQWLFHGTNLPGATDSAFNLQASALSDSGPYSLLVSNAFGTATSPTALLTVESILDCGLLTNKTLVLRESPYLLTCDLELENVAIEPGVRIEATGNFEIIVARLFEGSRNGQSANRLYHRELFHHEVARDSF